jgi:hypothetical protein
MLKSLFKPVSILPFITFRILFGIVVLYGLLISVYKGEIENRFTNLNFYFTYSGFEWLPYPGDSGVILLYFLCSLAAIGIILGFLYRFSVLIFGLAFSYLHTIDATNFINHYYLIWIFSVFLFFVPTNSVFSLDRYFGFVKAKSTIPNYLRLVFLIQIGIVYTSAGIAKLNSDWLFAAMPLKIWLGQHTDYPILGTLFQYGQLQYAFSWFAVFYDLTIVLFLLFGKTRKVAYFFVLIFHCLTASLFDIGLFPPLMMVSCLLFFSAEWHLKILKFFGLKNAENAETGIPKFNNFTFSFLTLFVLVQLILPFRHLMLTKNNILWTQEYYRYGWRVMLLENEGFAQFTVCDEKNGKKYEIDNNLYLSGYQIKRMSVQPEHIRQFAHFLAKVYSEKYQIENPKVTADVFVAYNGRVSKRLISKDVDLTKITTYSKSDLWILNK